MKTSKAFPPVSSPYGAPKGRLNTLPDMQGKPIRLRLTRAIWTDYNYDQGGAYWGYTSGDSIYCGHNQAGVRIYTRAKNEAEAAAAILADCPPKSTCGGRIMVNGYAALKSLRDAQTALCTDHIRHLSAKP